MTRMTEPDCVLMNTHTHARARAHTSTHQTQGENGNGNRDGDASSTGDGVGNGSEGREGANMFEGENGDEHGVGGRDGARTKTVVEASERTQDGNGEGSGDGWERE